MKQNPRQLINDIHETVSEDDTERKILADYSEDPTLWGYSKVWLFFMLIPAMVMFRVSSSFLTGQNQLYGFVATAVLAGLGILATVASPGDMSARDYFEAVVSRHAHQQEMIHDSAPDESRLEQPKNDSLLGRFARLPLVRDWPIIGAGDYQPTQELVAHKKPFRSEYAIERDDGGLIAGIRVRAIALRLESTDVKEKAEKAVANALEGTVDYDAEWFSPTRVANFERRRSEWKDRAREYQSQADRLVSAEGEDTTVDAIRQQILADIANERAAGINLYEDTKRIREHYIIVSVDPGEAVIDRSSQAGGLGSVPVFRWFVKKYRLYQQGNSDEHTATLINKLERRADDLERELRRIDGLTPNILPSEEFSEVVADYYRGTNVRAHEEFTQTIRGSPVPGGEEAGDPVHDVGYDHITNRDRAGSPSTPSPSPTSVHATDGGASESEQEQAEQTTDSDQQGDSQ
ncbi:hypothetical protein MUK72_19275 (plasmid) [Halococcus dombrowskii]|uniref:TraC-like domain-containing protein n=1 Tax=Halococcus dombrowskii TaxID=179637 RepID=A0AAV3SHN6_HALDO|nr:hypothetical protein [Halococcus dombrowskii]UOO97294.1 hypothetical protein MUK72_19275 [Halococcus dombrowskii]